MLIALPHFLSISVIFNILSAIMSTSKQRKTTEQFVAEARAIHGDKYDYSEVEYIGCTIPVKINCPIHGSFYQQPTLHLAGRGCMRCNMSGVKRTTLYGIATVDISDAHYSDAQRCYTLWENMLSRCYNSNILKRCPTYNGCSVCDKWLLFSNFKQWFDDNYIEGYDLDKDLLIKGNKVYSPETCCFLPHKLNCTINKCQRSRGKLPLGVSFDKTRLKYISYFRRSMKTIFIGRYDTPEEAFFAYKNAKEKYIKELAEKYFQEGKITKKVYDALMKYEVEITD